MAQGSVVEEQVWEREYIEHRAMARAMLARDFPSLPDPDEIYQEAWVEALELRARGHDLANVGGLLRVIVWRRARDRARKLSPELLDPHSGVFSVARDGAPLPEEQVELRIDAAVARQVAASLDERQAAAIKLRFEDQLDRKEIERRLGVTHKRLDKIFNTTFRQLEAVLTDLDDSGEWRRRQRSLLFACETGVASARQRRLARQMVAEDPRCRAMLSEIRSTLKGIAAVIPLPLVISAASDGRTARVRFAVVDRLSSLRDQLADGTSRLLGGHASTAEQATAGGAATAAGGLAVKTALVCVAVTGGAVVCVTSGVLGGSQGDQHHRPPPSMAGHALAVGPPRHAPVLPHIQPISSHRRVAKASVSRTAAVSAPPPPSPVPAGSTEFGPGSVGSTRAASAPAAAPSGGGGEFTP